MVETVHLTKILSALEANFPVATLLLDPSGRAGTFFKYKGATISADIASERQPTFVWKRSRHAITGGATLVFLLSHEHSIQSYFDANSFLPQTLVATELTDDLLQLYVDPECPGEYIRVDPSFKLVVQVRSDVVPEWAHELIDAGRLRPILVTIDE